MLAAPAVLENQPFIWVLRHIIKHTTLRQSYLCLESLYFCVAQSLSKFSSLMLPFGTECLPGSTCNPPGAELNPRVQWCSAHCRWLCACGVMGCGPLHCLSVVATVGAMREDWDPLCPPNTAPGSQRPAVHFSNHVRDVTFEAVQNNTAKFPNTPDDFMNICVLNISQPPGYLQESAEFRPHAAHWLQRASLKAAHMPSSPGLQGLPHVPLKRVDRTQLHTTEFCH